MASFLGSTAPSAFYVGSTAASAVYLGTNQVYAATPPVTDAFPGTSVDGTKWPTINGSPTVTGGRLRIAPTTSFPEVQTAVILNLNLYSLWVEVPTLPIVGNGTISTRFLLSNTNYTSTVQFQIEANPRIVYMAGIGPSITGSQVTYDSTAHRWLRFSISGGNLLWETAPLDKSVWTTRKTATAPTWLTTGLCRAILQVPQTGTVETSPGFAEFDNFNL